MAAKSKKPGPIVPAVAPASDDFQTLQANRRLKDVESARTIYSRMVQDDVLRSSTIAQVRNQLEGGRPFNPSDLEAQGAAWQTNVNFGDARSARDRTLIPYWKMLNDVPHKTSWTYDSTNPNTDKWNVAGAECFDEFLDDWDEGYVVQFMNFCSNYVNFGPGMVQWQVMDSPRYEALNASRVYFPRNCRMDQKGWEVVALVREISASELWSKIRNSAETKKNESAGWNEDAIKATLVQMQDSTGSTPDYRDFTKIADQLVNNDLAVTTPYQPMECIWLYVRQFDSGDKKGKVGCYCFTRAGAVNEFLFKDDGYADDFNQLIGAVWYDTGVDSMVHSIKGFGIKNYYFSALQNRIKSRLVDGAAVASGMSFQYSDDAHPDETPPVENYGPFTIFPSGMQQLQYQPNLQSAMAIEQMLNGNMTDQNSVYREQQQQIADTDTATQAKLLAGAQGQLTDASSSLFLAQVGRAMFTEQVRRLRRKGNSDPDAKAFVRRMRERGVPDEVIFTTPCRIKTGAAAGQGNPLVQGQKFQQLLQMSSSVPGLNQEWARDNWLAYTFGANAVAKATLPAGQNSQPAQRRLAKMENADFGQGIMLEVAPEDAHYEHLQEHLQPLGAIVQQYKQTQKVNPEQIMALTLGMEHSGQHMQFLSQDDMQKAQFRQITPIFRSLQSVTRGIITQAQAQQQQAQQGGQPQPGQPQGAPPQLMQPTG